MAKTLNPLATPYHKQSPFPTLNHEICTYKSPHPQPALPSPYFNLHFHHHDHQIMQQPPTFYAVNIIHLPQRKQPQLFIPPPSPAKKHKKCFANIPIPAGPRSGLRRKFTKSAVRSDTKSVAGGQNMVWRTKSTQKIKNHERIGEKKRWKNQTGDYFEMLPMEDDTTTVMIMNIPNRYTRQLLIQTLDNHCKNESSNNQGCLNEQNDYVSAYDFVYLPIDFKSRINAGFAFVNFTTPKAAFRFKDAFQGKRWEFFGSKKVAKISKARIQGKEALFQNCRRMNFEFGSDEDKPVIFEPGRDGSGRVVSKMHTLGQSFRALKM